MAAVEAIVKAVAPKPVNIVVGTKSEKPTVAQLSAAGVKRVSTGSALYAHTAAVLRAAAAALTQGDLATATTGMPLREVFSRTPDPQDDRLVVLNCARRCRSAPRGPAHGRSSRPAAPWLW
jgi:2-methylisocitrate lyase-like PEP mutase family enzyme